VQPPGHWPRPDGCAARRACPRSAWPQRPGTSA